MLFRSGQGMGERYGESGLHAADRSKSGSSVLDWTNGTRHVAVTEAVRRPIVVTVLSHVSPNLRPGLPFIRSARGSSYDDACTIKTLRIESKRESFLDSVGAQIL